MKILKQQFVEWWNLLTPTEKDDTAIALANECNAALSTIRSWGLGYRKPKARSQEIIVKYFNSIGIETDSITLFP